MAESSTWQLHATFKERLQAMIKESGGRVRLVSGYRSTEEQQRLYDAAVAKYGEANAGRWAATPGKSNHEGGLAGDIMFASDADKEWAHKNAKRFGLEFPMEWEPWHIEPLGLAAGTFDESVTPHGQAYTFFEGKPNPQDQTDRAGALQQILHNAMNFPGAVVEPNPPAEDNSTPEVVIENGDGPDTGN